MKKFLGLLFAALMLFSQTALAVEMPAPGETEWVLLEEAEGSQVWVDTANISFTEEADGPHAFLWQKVVEKKGSSEVVYTEMKLEARTVKYVELFVLDKKGNLKARGIGEEGFMDVGEDTVEAAILDSVALRYRDLKDQGAKK